MPVAIMRNAHEVIRGAMKDIQDLLDKDEFEAACALWHRFHRFSDLRKSCKCYMRARDRFCCSCS